MENSTKLGGGGANSNSIGINYSGSETFQNISREPAQYYDSWYSGFMCHQVISSQGTDWEKRVLVFQDEGFQPTAPPQCWEMFENVNTFLCFINSMR